MAHDEVSTALRGRELEVGQSMTRKGHRDRHRADTDVDDLRHDRVGLHTVGKLAACLHDATLSHRPDVRQRMRSEPEEEAPGDGDRFHDDQKRSDGSGQPRHYTREPDGTTE